LLLITVPFIFSGLFVYQRYSRNVENDSQQSSRQITNQLATNVDRYMKDIDRVTLGVFYDNSVMSILRKHAKGGGAGSYVTNEELGIMNPFMSSMVIDQSEIEGVFIFAEDGNMFSNLQNSAKSHWDNGDAGWMRVAKRNNGALTVIPPGKVDYYMKGEGPILSITRYIIDPLGGKGLGYVKVDLSDQSMKKILQSVYLSGNGQIYILNRDHEILYPFEDEGKEKLTSVDPRKYLMSTADADYAKLQIVGLVPRADLAKEPRQLVQYTAYISLLSLIAAYVVAIVISGRLVRPIRYLQKKMRIVEQGGLSEQAAVTTHDEIGQLTVSFNTMVRQLERTVKQYYELQIREKEAQLSVLQSQIHPHFLYNTLESIRMYAERDNRTELSAVIASLGELLRYTIDRKERHVLLRDEIEFVDHYLDVQKFRLEDRLRSEIRVDLSHEYCRVPKLILQPLVENAIEHGLGNGPLMVRIASAAEGEDLLVSVTDNGSGMSGERIREIEGRLTDTVRDERSRNKRSYALRNIHQRLQILYGPSYGLIIDKSRSCGTAVTLRLPLEWGGEEDAESTAR
jgi:two-component system sensor histidine kinase YesM